MRSNLIIAVIWLGLIGRALGQTIVLDNFNSGSATGAALSGTTWSGGGNVTQNSTSITIGGTAKDDNGWGWTGTALTAFNATGMNYVLVTGSINVAGGHDTASSFTIQFEDVDSRTQVFSLGTINFIDGTLSQVQIPISGWSGGFNSAQIVRWTIGGGTPSGLLPFRMTLDNLELSVSASAIPEPSTYVLFTGLLSIGFVVVSRIRRRGRRDLDPKS